MRNSNIVKDSDERLHRLRSAFGRAGLARIYGTRTPLPDNRDSREYSRICAKLESEAKAAKRGAWGKVNL